MAYNDDDRSVPELLRAAPKPYAEINPEDAKKLDVSNKEMIKVTTKRGSLKVEARVIDRPRKGTIFMPFHWGKLDQYPYY